MELAQSLEYWFRNKYQLSPQDPRYLQMSVEEIEIEFWAHIYHEKLSRGMKPDEILQSDNATADFDPEQEARREIDRIDELDGNIDDFEIVFNDKAKKQR